MSKNAALLLILVLFASSVISVLRVTAGSRIIVVPDDYPTIAAAIGNALDGDTIFVKTGRYEGPRNQTLFINKTISLIGEDPKSTAMNLHPPLVPMNIFTYEYMGYLHAIKIDADWVKISGFTIASDGANLFVTGNGTQIIGNDMSLSVLATGDGTKILNNILTGISSTGSYQTIAQNTIPRGYAEFLISCVGSYNTITSNRVEGSAGGIYTKGAHNIVHENTVTVESGIHAGVEVNGKENILYNNKITNFVNIGSSYNPESSSNIICGNTITSNLIIVGNNNTFNANYFQGIVLGNRIHDASNNIFYHNNFDFTETQVWYGGEKVFTVWEGVLGTIFLDNSKEGNYYSDYDGSDINSDGIGDTPYEIITKDPKNYHNVADFNIADMILKDQYPLMTPFDVSSVLMKLPEWKYALIQTYPSPYSPLSSSPSSGPTVFNSPSPTPYSSQEHTSTPESQSEASTIMPVAITYVSSVTVVYVVLIFYFRKRKR